MYSSCLHILILLHGDKSNDVHITFWDLSFWHDLLPIIVALSNDISLIGGNPLPYLWPCTDR